jgi:hypothetical protein
MRHLLFLLLVTTGCSTELVRQRELLSISNLLAQKCKSNLKDEALCLKALNCIDKSRVSSMCYQEYRARQVEGLDVDNKGKECSEKYLEAKKECK